MKLDPNKRYLLARPRGGFNDQLCQIERCAVYAQEHDRVLIIDLLRSGARVPIDTLFTFRDDFGPEVLTWTAEMPAVLDAAVSVFPHGLERQAGSYKSRHHRETSQFIVPDTGVAINVDFGKDYAEQVLVCEQSTGGRLSIRALKRLKFRSGVANEIIERLLPLGHGYDAVHIRHSDYKTDFDLFLKQMRPALEGRSVLICSDSVAAKAAAADILSDTTTVMSVSDIPDTGGRPLHMARNIDFQTASIDFLCDLIALARGEALFFSPLKRQEGRNARYSSFSVLAEMLRRNPDVVEALFQDADPVLRQRFFATPSPSASTESRHYKIAKRLMQRQLRNLLHWIAVVESDAYIPASDKTKKIVSRVTPMATPKGKYKNETWLKRTRRKLRSKLSKTFGLN